MTFYEAMEALERGETQEQYKKRMAKIRKYSNERDLLRDAIEILGTDPRVVNKIIRLEKVEQKLKELM